MRCSRAYVVMGLCTFCIVLSVLILLSSVFPVLSSYSLSPPPPAFWLRDHAGRVAVYTSPDPAATPAQVYNIYVNLLPEPDILRLKAEWPVADELDLQRTLEDLGL